MNRHGLRSRVDRGVAALRIPRRADDRLVAGVAGGVGARLGLDPFLVRMFVVLLSLTGGVGIAVYAALWFLSVPPDDAGAGAASGDGGSAATPPPRPSPREPEPRRALAAACIVGGAVLILRGLGLWLGDGFMFPVLALAIGAGVMGARSSTFDTVFSGRPSFARVGLGVALVLGGTISLAGRGGSFDDLRRAAVAASLGLAGALIVFGPWIGRLVRQLGDERRERIRTEERSDMAAHLHDSVLQTLALIQRNADDPRRMASLARRQERELRSWLYGRSGLTDPTAEPVTVVSAVEALAQEVEADHDIRVETVVVGDHALDDSLRALLGALRESLVNAARHAGVDTVDLFVEIEPSAATGYVHDRGCGFDPSSVGVERRGIADSIRGRIQRVGGSADIWSELARGTEIRLEVPLRIMEASA